MLHRRIGFESVSSPEIHKRSARKDTYTGVDQRKKRPSLAEELVCKDIIAEERGNIPILAEGLGKIPSPRIAEI